LAAVFVATGALATADAAERAGQTPRATVKLGGLAAATVVATNRGTAGAKTTNDNRDSTINESVAANANTAASTNTNDASDTDTNSNSSEANASAAAAANVAGGSSGGGSASVDVDGDEDATSSAAPVFLSTGDDTCMGSSGVGVQGMEFGFSVGSSWTDENCVMLKNARELKNQGHDKAARARLCMNDENALAFELAGEPCPRALPSTQAALARIREWNPDYQAAAEPGIQVASTGAVMPAAAGASANAETADADAEGLSPKIDGFLAMVSSVMDRLTTDVPGNSADDVTAMDGIE
jgi:hypothetical protein